MGDPEFIKHASLCRLCGNISHDGSYLFSENEKNLSLAVLINKYLPLRVEKDNKYPDKICTDCEVQLGATKLFFDLILQGQKQLKLIYDSIEYASKHNQLDSPQSVTSKLNRYEIVSGNGDKYVIEVIDDVKNEALAYTTEHEMVDAMNVLKKEKKKRGRPRKQIKDENEITEKKETEKGEKNRDETLVVSNDNGKRQRKKPARFTETVQEEELDQILKEEGIEVHETDQNNMPLKEEDKLIGRIKSEDGKDGEPIYIKTNSMRFNSNVNNDIPRKRRKRYKCHYCLEEFRNFVRLRKHIRENHEIIENVESEENKEIVEDSKREADQVECVDNMKIIKKVENFQEEHDLTEVVADEKKKEEVEVNSDVSKEKSKCEFCDKIFSTKQNLKIHMEGVHEKKRPFVCSVCNVSFPYAKTLKIHQLTHRRSIFYCEECDRSFNHPSSLMYHRNAEHNNGRRFVCTKCNKTFKHRALLHRHQLVHSEDRPFRCTMCPSAFKTKGNLLTHVTKHTGVKKYPCKECGQHFAHKTSLNLHARWHKGEKPFRCSVCQKSFSQKGNLVEHERIHTGEKPYKCELCGRSFTTSSQFKLHAKRHTGEKPWPCDLCPKKFLHKSSWETHKRAHLNDRPYKCQVCDKSFVTAHCLKKHSRFHNAPPFYCSVCLKGFTDSSNLKKHLRTHERKPPRKENLPQQQVSLLKTNSENNLFYVYYPTTSSYAKDHNILKEGMTDSTAQTEVELSVVDHQSTIGEETIQYQQLVDQEGNPLSLNTQDGQRINVVTSLSDGQEKLQGLLPDGTLISIDLNDNTKVDGIERLVDNMEESAMTQLGEETTLVPLVGAETSDEGCVVPHLIEGGANVSHLLLDGNMTFLEETTIDNKQSDSNILVTDQPICFVTYNSDLADI